MTAKTAETSPTSESLSAWGLLCAGAAARIYLTLVVALALCASLPLAMGLSGSVVQSTSMTPLIDAGDVVFTVGFAENEPTPLGRVVTFDAPTGSAQTGLVLHRIVAVEEDGQLVTAGDANADVDSTRLSRSDVLGRAVLLVPMIGLPSLWLTTGQVVPLGLWLLLTLAAIVVESRSLLATRRRHRANRSRKPLRAIPTVMLVVAMMVSIIPNAPLSQADASFTSQTSSSGNRWAYPAATPAVRLTFSTNPSSASTGGAAFATQPVVEFRDAGGKLTTNGGAVTLELTTPNGATLRCATNPVTSAHGRSTFTGCSIDKVGTYTLTARSGALITAVSTSVTVTRGPAAMLQFATAPSSTAVAATTFAVQPRVAITDAGGNVVTTSSAAVTLLLTGPAGATLTCTSNPRSASSGIATFAGCRINRTGTYQLVALSGALVNATSSNVVITPGVATRLAFATNPSNSTVGTPFPTQPVVVVQDANGNTVTTSTAPVTLSITDVFSGATGSCAANPVNASAGVATFSSCSINRRGTYTLTARSGFLTSSTSTTFTIN